MLGLIHLTNVISRTALRGRQPIAQASAAPVRIGHEPNLSSDGEVANIDIGASLIAPGSGPEKQELLRLIGTLTRGS
jgi:hypothetical protein